MLETEILDDLARRGGGHEISKAPICVSVKIFFWHAAVEIVGNVMIWNCTCQTVMRVNLRLFFTWPILINFMVLCSTAWRSPHCVSLFYVVR